MTDFKQIITGEEEVRRLMIINIFFHFCLIQAPSYLYFLNSMLNVQVGDRQFVTDSGLMVPAISLQLRERLETAMLSHGISRYVPLIGHYRVYMASNWSILRLHGLSLANVASSKGRGWTVTSMLTSF